jgi:hypothetical protein
MQHQAPTNAPGDLLGLTVPVGLKRVGREMRMLVENADDQSPADPGLLRIIARAHHIQARLIQNPKLTVPDIARSECRQPTSIPSCAFPGWRPTSPRPSSMAENHRNSPPRHA